MRSFEIKSSFHDLQAGFSKLNLFTGLQPSFTSIPGVTAWYQQSSPFEFCQLVKLFIFEVSV